MSKFILFLILFNCVLAKGNVDDKATWTKELSIPHSDAPRVIVFDGFANDERNVALTVDGVEYAFSFERQKKTLVIDFLGNRKLLYCKCCESMETWLIESAGRELKLEAVYVKKK